MSISLSGANSRHQTLHSGKISFTQICGLIILVCVTFLAILAGCTSDKSSVDQPIEDTLHSAYGKGSISFNIDSTVFFNVAGPYKPSDQFANDTASEGAGGFVKDTSLFGNKIQTLLTGYYQKQDSVNLTQYLMVIGLCDSAASLQTGAYTFTKNNHIFIGRNTYIYFIRTDSLHFSEIFVPKTGTLSLTFFNPTDHHVQGSFSGTLWGLPPDTTNTLNVTGGQFDLYLVNTFFNY
jgi:hypothetical protein